jgi:hypothetical protein
MGGVGVMESQGESGFIRKMLFKNCRARREAPEVVFNNFSGWLIVSDFILNKKFN